MISSMTGFGRASVERDGREVTVEAKSVNHRYLDIGFRIPRNVSFLEDTLRQCAAAAISRGHVDIYVNFTNSRSDAKSVTIDHALLYNYLQSARTAARTLGILEELSLSDLLELNGAVCVTETSEDTDAITALAREAAAKAFDALKKMRQKEGGALSHDLALRVDAVLKLTERIEARAPMLAGEYKSRLTERIAELLDGATPVDEGRLALEIALFADKAAIDEELVRVRSHVRQLDAALLGFEPVGRKLDFIVQELNREFNTIGSKANDVEITNLVISAKAEMEKIREQVQNVE